MRLNDSNFCDILDAIVNILDDEQLNQVEDIIVNQFEIKMNIDQLKKQNDLTSPECDACSNSFYTPNRITDKYADVFDVNFRKFVTN